MHCCLITAPTITEYQSRGELFSPAVQSAASQPQLGILSVAAVLVACGDRPRILDVNREYLSYAAKSDIRDTGEFAAYLAGLAVRSNADLYGFSSICSTYPLSLRVARHVKAMRPCATILFGGPQASVVDVATMTAFPFVDLILRGEVERTLPALVHELQSDYRLERVDGLTYRQGGTIRRNPPGPVIEDLDELPHPAYHLHDYLKGSKTASIELGRGCPFSCTFCSTNDFFRRRFRLRSPSAVLGDMRRIAAEYGVRHFELVHDMFTVDRKRVVAFCEAMLAAGDGFTWDCSARTDCVDEPLLEMMARSGCRGIFFGIETGSKRMQRVIDKDLDPERATEILSIAERLQMKTTASLITGFPEEEWNDVRDTLRIFMHSARCSLSHPQLNLLAPLAGTPIHTAHAHAMVLEELCSDMSHQGLSQNSQDLALIRTYPHIFPNFYLIPVQGLHREVLLELREFLSMAVECFRWLLCAIDQATDLLGFHDEWRAWRIRRRGNLVGSDLRGYYVRKVFQADFLHFVAQHPLRKDKSVFALARAEETIWAAGELKEDDQRQGTRVSSGKRLKLDDVPCRARATRTLRLQASLSKIVHAVAARSRWEPFSSPSFYATRCDQDGTLKLVEISRLLFAVIEACDGKRSVAQVFEELELDVSGIETKSSRYLCKRLVSGAQSMGFLEVRRR